MYFSNNDGGGGRPPVSDSELYYRQRNARRREDEKRRNTALILFIMTLLGVGSSVGFLADMLSEDGFGLMDFVICAGLGLGVFLGVNHMWRKGAEDIPDKPRHEREMMVTPYVIGMGLWCAVSVTSTAAWTAHPPAAVADLTKRNEYVIEQSTEVETSHGSLYAIIPSLETQGAAFMASGELEKTTGGFSETGSGTGPTYTQLRILTLQTLDTAEALAEEQRRNKPMMERMAANREAMRRVMENDGLEYAEKSDRVRELRESLITDTKALQAALNVQSIRQLRDTYSADFASLGLSPLAVNKLRDMLGASLANLDAALRQSVRDSEIVLQGSESMFPLAVIARNIETVWPMVLLSGLPEFVTAFLVFITFISNRREDDEFDGGEPGAGSGSKWSNDFDDDDDVTPIGKRPARKLHGRSHLFTGARSDTLN